MARRPNYNFERQERQRAKAAKKAEKLKAKREKAEGVSDETEEADIETQIEEAFKDSVETEDDA